MVSAEFIDEFLNLVVSGERLREGKNKDVVTYELVDNSKKLENKFYKVYTVNLKLNNDVVYKKDYAVKSDREKQLIKSKFVVDLISELPYLYKAVNSYISKRKKMSLSDEALEAFTKVVNVLNKIQNK